VPKRGPTISPSVKKLIQYVALKDRRPRRPIALGLQRQIEGIGEPVPGKETLERMISAIRNRAAAEEDGPWHVGTLVRHPMPSEALSTVLRAWADALQQDRPFTIREALWVARLFHIFKEAGPVDDIRLLTEIARDYAMAERVDSLTEESADNRRPVRLHWIDDARLFRLLYKDGRPMAKVMSQIKWRQLTDAEAQRLGLPELFRSVMEGGHEGSHSQTVQG
jgi:hypothetical protein